MKIPGSVSELFSVYRDNARTTQGKVEDLLKKWCFESHWHFESRIKSELSFAQKIETGRYGAKSLDDVYACTIIVRDRSEIEHCLNKLKGSFPFRFVKQVPKDINISNIPPQFFDFDSVRLYFKPEEEDIGPNPYEEQLFEIQVKTLIEQAWSLATHEFHYKSNFTSWARSRVASQIKALLDAAELAIVEAYNLSDSPVIQKQDVRLDGINGIITYFKDEWEQDKCPKDLRRLAENVQNLLLPIKKDVEWLKLIIEEESNAGRGKHSVNLAPYWVVFQAIINNEGEEFFRAVKKYKFRGREISLSVIDEIEIPDTIDLSQYSNFHRL